MRRLAFRGVAAWLLIWSSSRISEASWLSDITGVDINVPRQTITFGAPRPDRIPMMLQNLPKDLATSFLNPAGAALAFAIRQAKESARQNCLPMPPQVVNTLSAFFPGDVFPAVCWAVVANGFTLDSFAIQDAAMAAITLEDVVVFSKAEYATDPILWSHELTHVIQFRRLGVEAFAALYAGAFDAIEQEARLFDQFVARALQTPVANAQYWSATNGWSMNQRISYDRYTYYARQSISPSTCVTFVNGKLDKGAYPPPHSDWHVFINYVEVTNRCPVAITVTTVSMHMVAKDGTPFPGGMQRPCPFDCTIQSGRMMHWDLPPDYEATDVSMTW